MPNFVSGDTGIGMPYLVDSNGHSVDPNKLKDGQKALLALSLFQSTGETIPNKSLRLLISLSQNLIVDVPADYDFSQFPGGKYFDFVVKSETTGQSLVATQKTDIIGEFTVGLLIPVKAVGQTEKNFVVANLLVPNEGDGDVWVETNGLNNNSDMLYIVQGKVEPEPTPNPNPEPLTDKQRAKAALTTLKALKLVSNTEYKSISAKIAKRLK